MASSVFRQCNPLLFYSYVYLYIHYDLLDISSSSNRLIKQPHDPEKLERYVLTEKLGLRVVELPVKGLFMADLRRVLDCGWPVLIPINKRRLMGGGQS